MRKKTGLTLERHEAIERLLGEMYLMTTCMLDDVYLAYPVNGPESRGLEKVRRAIEKAKARMQEAQAQDLGW